MDKEPSVWWIGALILAGLFAIGAKMAGGGWLSWMFGIIAGVLGMYGGIAFLNWALYNFASTVQQGIYDINMAKVAHTIALATSLRVLSNRQLDALSSGQTAVIEMLKGDTGPAYFIRGLKYSIPFYIAQEYLDETREDGYLFPIREGLHKDYVADFTNLMIAHGLAEPAAGIHPARLKHPLDYVRAQYGMG